MATQAEITIGGVPGSDDDLSINTLVQFNNNGLGGELTYLWAILDQPEGAADALSALNIQNPTLTPRKEGSYLIRITVNLGMADEKTDLVVAAVRQLKSRMRIPAAGETVEVHTLRGWADEVNRSHQFLDRLKADPTVFVAEMGLPLATAGQIVYFEISSVIKAGLPGQETVPTAVRYGGGTYESEQLFVLVSGVNGSPAPAQGDLIYARAMGRVETALAGATTDPIYADAATGNLTTAVTPRKVGYIMDGGTHDVWFDGTSAGGGALAGPILTQGPAAIPGSIDVENVPSTLLLRTLGLFDVEIGLNGALAWTFAVAGGHLIASGAANKNVKNIADPIDPQDAATKAYVDASLGYGDAVYGNKADGDADLDNANLYPWATLFGGYYTLGRDVCLDHLIVRVPLYTNGYRVYAHDVQILPGGEVEMDGVSGLGSAGGTLIAGHSVGGGQFGGDGGVGGANGNAGGGVIDSFGGAGGAGGDGGGGHIGGAGGTSTVPALSAGTPRTLFGGALGHLIGGGTLVCLVGGAGGGGGASEGAGGAGGGGGGGAGVVDLAAKVILNRGHISAIGGRGAAGVAGGGAGGGGGGGGGGTVFLLFHEYTSIGGVIEVDGGAGGAPDGAGALPGADGALGTIIQIQN